MARAKKKAAAAKRNRSVRTTAKQNGPLAEAKPVDFDRLLGGLPDDRSAEEILADLYAMKYGRTRQ